KPSTVVHERPLGTLMPEPFAVGHQIRQSNLSPSSDIDTAGAWSFLMRVVVVDPSRTVLKFVARMLEAGGHEVCPFNDAHAALAHLEADAGVGALITSAELLSMAGVEL